MTRAVALPRGNQLEITTWERLRSDPDALAAWTELLERRPAPSRLHSSPEWMDHLAATGAAVTPLVVRSAQARVIGLIPTFRLRLVLGRGRRSGGVPLSTLSVGCVLGSVPLLPNDPTLLGDVVAASLAALPGHDGLYFDALPVDDGAFALFEDGRLSRGRFLPHRLDAGQQAHSLEFGASFHEYFESRSAKSRYNLRRAQRVLERHGEVEVRRYRSAAELDEFFRAAVTIHGRSWHRSTVELCGDAERYRTTLNDFARRGWLRCYVLRCGGAPRAFVAGYQGQGVFHYQEIAHDEAFDRFSPGTVLLLRVLEDLFGSDPPATLDFGVGDDVYKRRFGTRARGVTAGLLLRATRRNQLKIGAHRALRLAARVKRAISELGRR